MPDWSSVGKEFFADFIDYVITNGLTNLLGLQVLIDGMDQSMWELILDRGDCYIEKSSSAGLLANPNYYWLEV